MQADYALFICGAAALLLSGSCFLKQAEPGHGKAWRCLARFALLQGTANWLSLFIWSFSGEKFPGYLSAACMMASYLYFFRFCLAFYKDRQPGAGSGERNTIRQIVFLIATCLLVQVLAVIPTGFAEISLCGGAAPVRLALLLQIISLGGAAMLCLSVVPAGKNLSMLGAKGFHLFWLVALGVLIFFGWLATGYIAVQTDAELRENLLRQTETAAVAIRPKLVAQFDDYIRNGVQQNYHYSNPELQAIRQANPNIKWLYVMVRQGGEIVFAYSSQSEGQYEVTEPGRAYKKYPGELLDTISNGRPVTVGPYSDEWGSFVSGFAGIRDLNTGDLTSVLGIDIDAGDWQRTVFRHRLAPICISMLIFLIGLVFYITRQRLWEAVERTATSEERFALAMQGANDGLWDWNLVTDEVYFSPQWKRMMGFEQEETVKDPQAWSLLLHPEDRDKTLAHLRDCLQGQVDRLEYEVRMRHKDGHYLDILARAFAVRRKTDGTPIRLVGTQVDVTEKNTAAHELQLAKEAAEKAAKIRSAFLANMSHEIRTPINAILGFTQLMLQEAGLTQDRQQSLLAIQRSGEHLLAVINEILEMSKLEATKTELYQDEFVLPEFLQEVSSLFVAQMKEKGLRFSCIETGDMPSWIKADKQKLRQIMINLMGNAVKFTDSGAVEVAYEVRKPPGDAGIMQLVWKVRDNGPGIDTGDIECIFSPFTQVEAGRKNGGTGLGLAISREYARLMGGDISVTSQLGIGSIFCLEVPIQSSVGDDRGDRAENNRQEYRSNETVEMQEAAMLPREIIAKLNDAVLRARIDEFIVLVDQMKGEYPSVARQLERLAERYEYEKIIALLKILDCQKENP